MAAVWTPPVGLTADVDAKLQGIFANGTMLTNLCDQGFSTRLGTTNRITTQRRIYDGGEPEDLDRQTAQTTDSGTIRNAANLPAMSSPEGVEAAQIVITKRTSKQKSYGMARQNFEESPVAESANAVNVITNEIRQQMDRAIRDYFLGIASTGGDGANGGGGAVTKITLGTAGTDYLSPTRDGMGNYDATGFDGDWFLEGVVDQFVLHAKRNNLFDGVTVYGDGPGRLYLVVHPEIMQQHVVRPLRKAGYQLDPLTNDSLRNTAVFGSNAFEARLGLNSLIITAPNVLTVPSGGGNNPPPWRFWGGYTEAVAAGISNERSRLYMPGEYPIDTADGVRVADGYVWYGSIDPHWQLMDGKGVVQFDVVSDATA